MFGDWDRGTWPRDLSRVRISRPLQWGCIWLSWSTLCFCFPNFQTCLVLLSSQVLFVWLIGCLFLSNWLYSIDLWQNAGPKNMLAASGFCHQAIAAHLTAKLLELYPRNAGFEWVCLNCFKICKLRLGQEQLSYFPPVALYLAAPDGDCWGCTSHEVSWFWAQLHLAPSCSRHPAGVSAKRHLTSKRI